MMGKFGDTMLPSNISPESLADKFNEFFVHKIDEIRRSFDQFPLTQLNSLAQSLQSFNL